MSRPAPVNTWRRRLAGTTLMLALLPMASIAQNASPTVEVWKSPSCGCCAAWVKHLEANGFTVRVHDIGNGSARARLGVPTKLGSCHTAQVSGYAIEGHVPATDIKRLLVEKPSAAGLAVPGMPIGSPGMEHGNRRDPYDVMLIERGGNARVFQSYR